MEDFHGGYTKKTATGSHRNIPRIPFGTCLNDVQVIILTFCKLFWNVTKNHLVATTTALLLWRPYIWLGNLTTSVNAWFPSIIQLSDHYRLTRARGFVAISASGGEWAHE